MTAALSYFKDPANALEQLDRLLDHENGEVPLKVDKSLLNEVTDLLSEVDLGKFKGELSTRWRQLEDSLAVEETAGQRSFTVLEFLKDVRTAAEAAQDPIHQN